MDTLTSGTVTIPKCIDSVSARQHNWGTDGLQMNCVGGEQSHAS